MSAPLLRFKNNHEQFPDYIQKLLGEVVTFSKGGKLSKSDLNEHGAIPCILYGELYTHYREIATNIVSRTSDNGTVFSKEMDVILPSSGETAEDISTATCVLSSGVAYGGDLIVLRSKSLNGVYLSYSLNGPLKRQIARLAQGKSVVHISADRIKNIAINVPSIDEQQKIATFFSTLDEKIELSERKLEALEQLKKGLMQKIFSQEIQFHQDNGENYPTWNKTKLGIFFNKISSGKSKKINSGSFLLYGATGVIGKTNDSPYKGDKILVARVGSVGTVNFVTEPVGISDNTLILSSPQSGLDLKWLYYYFEYFDLSKLSAGSSQKLITSTQLKNFSIRLPSIFEQKEIAALFTLLDSKIKFMKHQNNLLNNLKLGFMQQMFV